MYKYDTENVRRFYLNGGENKVAGFLIFELFFNRNNSLIPDLLPACLPLLPICAEQTEKNFLKTCLTFL